MAEHENDPGIRRTDLYNIHFYETLPFYGSFRGMHYRIAGVAASGGDVSDREASADIGTAKDHAPADAGKQLCVTTWPGPYNYETTDDSLKETVRFAFSNEGLDAVADYLNTFYREHFA